MALTITPQVTSIVGTTNEISVDNPSGKVTLSLPDSISAVASSVANSFVIKFDTGTAENTDLYSFSGSAAKTIDIKPGSNVTFTKAANSITINSSYTNTTYSAGTGLSLASTTFSLADSYGDTKNPYASKTAKHFLAAPNGADGAPAFRAIVASDIPTLNQSTTGSAAKLTTAVTIGISTGATGTATSFDGSGNITIPITSLDASYLSGTIPSTVLGNSSVYIGTTSVALNRASAILSLADIKLGTLTSNGFVKTSGSDGTLSVDTSSYITGNQTITLSGAVTGSGATTITTSLAASQTALTSVGTGSSSLTISGTGGLVLTAGSATTGDGALFKTSATPAPTGTANVCYDGYFYASRVYNAVWNDIADFVEVDENTKIEFGKVYYRDKNYKISVTNKYAQSAIGIASDTYGFGVGQKDKPQIPIAIGGWVLAYTDKVYKPGTPLVATKYGYLTKARWYTVILNSDRIIAHFDRPELEAIWNGIEVNTRNWVKVK